MNILLILTGGTIACKTVNSTMEPAPENALDILRMYRAENPYCDINFIIEQPFTILSENYTAEAYNMLIDFISAIKASDYDGIIITHGSDTLSYTSALVGMLMRNTDVPIMMTAADYPPDNNCSNGLSNFSACVEFIRKNLSCGIFTVYGKKDNPFVYLSTGICEADPLNDRFSPFGDGVIAEFENGILKSFNTSLAEKLKSKKHSDNFFVSKPVIKNDVLLIKNYPNQNFSFYNISSAKAVVIYMYHSATACTTGKNTNICRFIEKCNSEKIPVYLASFKHRKEKYATSSEIEKYNAVKLFNISKECAYIKALLAFNQCGLSPDYVMSSDIYFESDNSLSGE